MKIELKEIVVLVWILMFLPSLNLIGQNKEAPLPLMPWPEKIQVLEGTYQIDRDFSVSISGPNSERLSKGLFRFLTRLDNKTGVLIPNKETLASRKTTKTDLTIKFQRKGLVDLNEVESYQLRIGSDGIFLNAETDIGIIHGFQTLFQLLSNDSEHYHFPYVNIEDSPRFKWRGLMIDASRHFQPVEVLKRNIDGMEAVKLNVLHLHLSDDQGFRIESKKFPQLNTLAADGMYYTHEQVNEIIQYADDRGIRVVPEIDIPGHATAILSAYPQYASKDSTYELVRKAGVFNATLNPILPETYVFLDALFSEIAPLFPDAYFHIGGDENEGLHWTENKKIQAFKRKHKIQDNHMLQAYFNRKVQDILYKYDKKMMGWEEIQVDGLDTSATIHAWRGENEGFKLRQSLYSAVKNGYDAVLSDGYYIDRMNSIASHYMIDPLPEGHNLSKEESMRVLGGEATMWSELVTPLTIDSRIWPRMAAIAERFWSPSEVNDTNNMYIRLERVSYILESYGLTHMRNKELILRNLSNGTNTEALRVLVDVIEPLKGYTRNPNGDLYDTFSPFTLLADAASTDAIDARKFDVLVKEYISNESDVVLIQINRYLNTWKNNHDLLIPTIKSSPILKEAFKLSENLSLTASIGLEALNFLSSKKAPQKGWFSESSEILENSREQSGRTELQVVDPVQKLVTLVQKKFSNFDFNQE